MSQKAEGRNAGLGCSRHRCFAAIWETIFPLVFRAGLWPRGTDNVSKSMLSLPSLFWASSLQGQAICSGELVENRLLTLNAYPLLPAHGNHGFSEPPRNSTLTSWQQDNRLFYSKTQSHLFLPGFEIAV